MDKLIAFFDVFRKGKEIANVETWKAGGITTGMVVAFLTTILGLARAYGVNIQLTDAQLANLAVAAVGLGSFLVSLFTAATSARAGILPARTDAIQPVGEAVAGVPTPLPATPGDSALGAAGKDVPGDSARRVVAVGDVYEPD